MECWASSGHWGRGWQGEFRSSYLRKLQERWHLVSNNGRVGSESESRPVVSNSLLPHGLYSPWNYPGQNTGVGSLSLLQGSSQPRDRTQVSRTAGRFFTSWATRKAWGGVEWVTNRLKRLPFLHILPQEAATINMRLINKWLLYLSGLLRLKIRCRVVWEQTRGLRVWLDPKGNQRNPQRDPQESCLWQSP